MAPYYLSVYPLEMSLSSNMANSIYGLMSPFIAIAAAILTFMAFWVQYQANDSLKRDALKKNATDKFFEMLRMHNDNMKNLDFGCYLDEFSSIFKIYRFMNETTFDEIIEAITSAYKLFFYGVDGIMFEPEWNVLVSLRDWPRSVPLDMSNPKNKFFDYIINHHTDFEVKPRTIEFVGKSELYNGRKKNLVRYYRHLYLMVKFVANNKNFNFSEKRELLRILRAQMSGEEQLMLFFNWASGVGIQWEETKSQYLSNKNKKIVYNHFFTEFRVIHNIIPEQLEFLGTDDVDVNADDFVSLIKALCPDSSLPPNTPSDPEKNGIDTIFEFEDWEKKNTYFNYDKSNFL